jgi:hypothetical protein
MTRPFSARDWGRLQPVFDWILENLGPDAWRSQFEVSGARIDPERPVVRISHGLDHQRPGLTGMSENAFRLANDPHDHDQQELGSLTRNSTRIVAREREHLILESRPKLVLDALDQLLYALRAGH